LITLPATKVNIHIKTRNWSFMSVLGHMYGSNLLIFENALRNADWFSVNGSLCKKNKLYTDSFPKMLKEIDSQKDYWIQVSINCHNIEVYSALSFRVGKVPYMRYNDWQTETSPLDRQHCKFNHRLRSRLLDCIEKITFVNATTILLFWNL
jgi:hypothetical protein